MSQPSAPFSCFKPVTVEQIRKLILKSKPTTTATDPVPTKFLLDFTDVLSPVVQKIVNLSLQSGIVSKAGKKAVVKSQTLTLMFLQTTGQLQTIRICLKSSGERFRRSCGPIWTPPTCRSSSSRPPYVVTALRQPFSVFRTISFQ